MKKIFYSCILSLILFLSYGIKSQATEVIQPVNINGTDPIASSDNSNAEQNKTNVLDSNVQDSSANKENNQNNNLTDDKKDKTVDDLEQEPIVLPEPKKKVVKKEKKVNKPQYPITDFRNIKTHLKKENGFYYYLDDKKQKVEDLVTLLGEKWFDEQKALILISKLNSYGTILVYNPDTKQYDIPAYTFLCSPGNDTPIIKRKLNKLQTYRWKELMGPTFGQFSTRIKDSFLFHSILYRRPNKNTLKVSSWNNLGKRVSHGCIRLKVSEARLVYNHVRSQDTTVDIRYNPKMPFPKPHHKFIPYSSKASPDDIF